MAEYRPITVTKENAEYAVRENILEALRVLETKLRVDKALPMNDIDSNSHLFRLVQDGLDESAACTLSQFYDIKNDAEFRVTEDGEMRITENGVFRVTEYGVV